MPTQLQLFGDDEGRETARPKPAEAKPRKLVPPKVIHVQPPEVPPVVEEPLQAAKPKPVTVAQPVQAAPKKTRGRKSIREMSLEAAKVEIPPDDVLSSRQYYGIGEVAAMFQVKPSLLRYWESEFDILKLRKNKKGDRFFRPEDIRSLQMIHHLLRERKYTIEGAKDFLRNSRKAKEKFEAVETLKRIRSFLVEMKAGLNARRED